MVSSRSTPTTSSGPPDEKKGLTLWVRPLLGFRIRAMRLALIADIHGNLPALDNVLADLDREHVDQIVCLGDVGVGPQPVETLERLRRLGCPTIMGNWDACMLGDEPKVDGELAEMLVDVCTWSADQLSESHREYMRGFQDTLELRLDDDTTLSRSTGRRARSTTRSSPPRPTRSSRTCSRATTHPSTSAGTPTSRCFAATLNPSS